MSADATWLRQRIAELHDSIAQARWHLTELENCRRETAPFWNDSCATTVSTRFLEPLAHDAANSLSHLKTQVENLAACTDSLFGANQSFEATHEATREVRRLIVETKSILRIIDSILNEVLTHVDESAHHTSEARALLAHAEAAGAG